MPNTLPIIFLIGPTAVGKSDVALQVAKKINGEIISCDSMQIYQELRIVVNKPAPDTFLKIPHHVMDIVSVEQSFDVAQFNQKAIQAIKKKIGRAHV